MYAKFKDPIKARRYNLNIKLNSNVILNQMDLESNMVCLKLFKLLPMNNIPYSFY